MRKKIFITRGTGKTGKRVAEHLCGLSLKNRENRHLEPQTQLK
ncbi:MAG: hypothetical protein SFV55_14065 [Haliscomenobacter sp.]|nr:hypothetical protein [Haliscomenobacter sp.]MDX2069549.1 hypothetical protein [Haliscomenobacter sp.]